VTSGRREGTQALGILCKGPRPPWLWLRCQLCGGGRGCGPVGVGVSEWGVCGVCCVCVRCGVCMWGVCVGYVW
jgi:hypothetical protein